MVDAGGVFPAHNRTRFFPDERHFGRIFTIRPQIVPLLQFRRLQS